MKRVVEVLTLLLFLLCLPVAAQTQQTIRVNAGGPAYHDAKGQLWSADYGFNTGDLSNSAPLATVTGTSDPKLFKSARFAPSHTPELEYQFALANGTYKVNLYFAETAWTTKGKRVFDVQMQGANVFSGLDIFAAVGADRALVKSALISVTNRTIIIRFVHHTNADNPIISAIEILPSGGSSSSAPSVTTQPASQSITAGQTAKFEVVAEGTAPLSYQWQRNSVPISGATSASYSTPVSTSADDGETFRVVISNSVGSTTSNSAKLSVVSGPAITKQPANQTVSVGQTAIFSVVASGTAPLSYQWTRNGSSISGATAASYTTPPATSSVNGSTFQVEVNNSEGHMTSTAASLTVGSQATVTTASLPGGTVGTAYSTTLQASGGTTPYTWSISSGSLPAGLSLVASTGVISGTPTTAATASFTVQVKDAASNTATASLSITISPSGTQPQTDQYGGLVNVPCTNTNTAFAIVKVGSNLVFCTPQGHAMFARGFYVMDLNLGTDPDETGGSYNQYVLKKYGTAQTWYTQELNRMQSWGMNSVGPYGNANLFPSTGQTTKVPFVLYELASVYSLVNKLGWGTGAAKEMYKLLSPQWGGFVGNTGIADYRDPNWAGMVSGVLNNDWATTTVAGTSAANKGYLLGFSFDDSDGLHGFGAGPDFATQPAGDNDFRLGYMGFFIAPTDYANSSQGEIYPDATVYLKKRFHDMLAAKYGTVNALNNAWGSGYTTLDSSGTCIGTAPVTCASDLSAETVGTGNGSTKSFSHTLSHATVSRFSLGIFVGGVLVGGDSGDGTIYGSGVSGSVNYSTGALSLSFGTAPGANAAVTANYIQNGWGIGSGFMDEDCRSSHSSYCGDGSANTTVYLTGVAANAQTDLNALTKDTAAYYSSTIHSKIQAWGAAHGFTGHIPYLGPTTLGTWTTPPDRYVLQGFAGNVDAWQYGGVGTFSQAELDFVNTYMGDVGLIEGEYRTANADSPYAWPNSPCTHSGSTVTCTIASPNHFSSFAGSFHIDSSCNNADYNIMNVNYSATASTVTYSAAGTPSEASATCKVFFDDANVGGFATQNARGQDFFNKVSILPSRSFTATGTHPYVGYYWWQYFDNEAEKLDWGPMTLRDNAYDGNEAVNPIVVCSDPTQAYSCGGEVRGPVWKSDPTHQINQQAIDNTLLALP